MKLYKLLEMISNEEQRIYIDDVAIFLHEGFYSRRKGSTTSNYEYTRLPKTCTDRTIIELGIYMGDDRECYFSITTK